MNSWKGQKKTLAVIQLVHTKWNGSTLQQLLLSRMAEFPVKTLVSLCFFFLFSHSAPPLFFQTQTACEMHHCQATACQNRSVFGKSKIRLKCKHTKNHPCPLSSTTQSLQNSLMIKADSNTWPISGMLSTVHRFFSCRLCPCEQRALGAAALAACAGSLIAMGILPQTSKQGQGSRLGFT